jgi:hypothetical protein
MISFNSLEEGLTNEKTLRRHQTRCIIRKRHSYTAHSFNAPLDRLLALYEQFDTTITGLVDDNQDLGNMMNLHGKPFLRSQR